MLNSILLVLLFLGGVFVVSFVISYFMTKNLLKEMYSPQNAHITAAAAAAAGAKLSERVGFPVRVIPQNGVNDDIVHVRFDKSGGATKVVFVDDGQLVTLYVSKVLADANALKQLLKEKLTEKDIHYFAPGND